MFHIHDVLGYEIFGFHGNDVLGGGFMLTLFFF